MKTPPPQNAIPLPEPAPPEGAGVVDAHRLAEALDTERRLLAELASVLHRLREGVAVQDFDLVHASTMSANRVIHTLGEARRLRRLILRILGGLDDEPLIELERVLGPEMTPEVVVARERLWTEEESVGNEIAANRRVWRHVLPAYGRPVRNACPVTAPAPSPVLERRVHRPRYPK